MIVPRLAAVSIGSAALGSSRMSTRGWLGQRLRDADEPLLDRASARRRALGSTSSRPTRSAARAPAVSCDRRATPRPRAAAAPSSTFSATDWSATSVSSCGYEGDARPARRAACATTTGSPSIAIAPVVGPHARRPARSSASTCRRRWRRSARRPRRRRRGRGARRERLHAAEAASDRGQLDLGDAAGGRCGRAHRVSASCATAMNEDDDQRRSADDAVATQSSRAAGRSGRSAACR